MHAVICQVARSGLSTGVLALGSWQRDALGQVLEDCTVQGRGRRPLQLVQAPPFGFCPCRLA